MKKLFCALAFATVGFSAAAMADDGFKLIHVPELQETMKTNAASVHVYDANNQEVRKANGIIPGAVVLANSSQYDTAKVLPADKTAQLVFYCANTACSASHSAAKRAVGAGYKNVAVLADGIEGWKKAGLKTQPL